MTTTSEGAPPVATRIRPIACTALTCAGAPRSQTWTASRSCRGRRSFGSCSGSATWAQSWQGEDHLFACRDVPPADARSWRLWWDTAVAWPSTISAITVSSAPAQRGEVSPNPAPIASPLNIGRNRVATVKAAMLLSEAIVGASWA
jgi:hypothetical protein